MIMFDNYDPNEERQIQKYLTVMHFLTIALVSAFFIFLAVMFFEPVSKEQAAAVVYDKSKNGDKYEVVLFINGKYESMPCDLDFYTKGNKGDTVYLFLQVGSITGRIVEHPKIVY